MVRARAGHQRPPGVQQPKRPQVQLLVPAYRAFHRPLRFRKRRRVEHNRIELPRRILARGFVVRSQQVKGVSLDPVRPRLQIRIPLKVPVRRFQRRATRIDSCHSLANLSQMQRKPTLIRAYIQRLVSPSRILNPPRRRRVIQPLIQKRTRLLPRRSIVFKPQTV